MCASHYNRWKRHGDPLYEKTVYETHTEKMLAVGWTVTESGCWEYDGGRTNKGYGAVTIKGKQQSTHRLAHELWIGAIPDGHMVRHRCDNPPCVNPEHLETGTHADNVNDMVVRERCSRNKLTGVEVIEMRSLYHDSQFTYKDLSDRYGVTVPTVINIIARRRWKHV